MIKYFICADGYREVASWREGVWVSVVMPTEQELNLLVEDMGIPLSFLHDIDDREERPRIEEEEGWRLVILRAPYKAEKQEDHFSTVPLGILSNDKYFVTVSYYSIAVLADFVDYSCRKRLNNITFTNLTLHLILSSAVWFMKYLKALNGETHKAEQTLQCSIRNEELLEMMRLERVLVYFITSLKGNEILIKKFKNLLKQIDTRYNEDLLEDVEIETQQALVMANVHSDILSGMMDAFASVISNNLNVLMKRLTSASIILMIPTLIASLYGMNVPNSLQDSPYGMILIVVASILISILSVLFFVKKRWL